MWKTFTAGAIIALISTNANAQPVATGFYGEIGVGLSLIQSATTEPFSADIGLGTLAGTMDTEFASPQGMFGAEVGFASARWRFGVSYDWMDAPIESVAFSGTFNGSPLNTTIEKDDLDALGFQTDTGFLIAGGNVYYNFLPSRSAVEPYIGVGVGAAIVQNASTELALSATAGARYAITPRAYVGARYRFVRIAGPKDDSGIQYDNIFIHMISVQLGLYL
jgi:hypothetical protein